MITVSCSTYSVTAYGHANYAAEGQDIVCAAFTILISTLCENIIALQDEGKLASSKIELDKGHAIIQCIPLQGFERETELIYDTVITGIKILENEYPENILVKK